MEVIYGVKLVEKTIPPGIKIATGYRWRCPECDAVGFVPSALVKSASCEECGSAFPVIEVRHRTNDLDLDSFPGSLIVLDKRSSDDGKKNKKLTGYRKRRSRGDDDLSLMVDAGAMTIAGGYQLWCKKGDAVVYVATAEGAFCSECDEHCPIEEICHCARGGEAIRPGIRPGMVYVPDGVEYAPGDMRARLLDEAVGNGKRKKIMTKS